MSNVYRFPRARIRREGPAVQGSYNNRDRAFLFGISAAFIMVAAMGWLMSYLLLPSVLAVGSDARLVWALFTSFSMGMGFLSAGMGWVFR